MNGRRGEGGGRETVIGNVREKVGKLGRTGLMWVVDVFLSGLGKSRLFFIVIFFISLFLRFWLEVLKRFGWKKKKERKTKKKMTKKKKRKKKN